MADRRFFLKKLLGVPIFGSILFKKVVDQKIEKEYFFDQYFVAGFQYHNGPELLDYMKIGHEISMRAEPKNPYDHYAVELSYDNKKIGYIPRKDNKHISRFLRQDCPLICRIIKIQPDEPTWELLQVAIWI